MRKHFSSKCLSGALSGEPFGLTPEEETTIVDILLYSLDCHRQAIESALPVLIGGII